jgi:hypothetical protein
LFASHKLPLRTYLATVAVFCNEVKGKSMLALSRDLHEYGGGIFQLLAPRRDRPPSPHRGNVFAPLRPRGVMARGQSPGLLRYAQEASWREDNRRAANGEQTQRVAHLAMKRKPSVDFSGYWQRHVKAA